MRVIVAEGRLDVEFAGAAGIMVKIDRLGLSMAIK
jgi:hypothetical protein